MADLYTSCCGPRHLPLVPSPSQLSGSPSNYWCGHAQRHLLSSSNGNTLAPAQTGGWLHFGCMPPAGPHMTMNVCSGSCCCGTGQTSLLRICCPGSCFTANLASGLFLSILRSTSPHLHPVLQTKCPECQFEQQVKSFLCSGVEASILALPSEACRSHRLLLSVVQLHHRVQPSLLRHGRATKTLAIHDISCNRMMVHIAAAITLLSLHLCRRMLSIQALTPVSEAAGLTCQTDS